MTTNRRGMGEAALAGIVRRVVSFRRSITDGVSRTVGHGINLMAIVSRRSHHRHRIPPPPPPPPTATFQLAEPPFPETGDEKWVFLDKFERQYGSVHPFFYACRFEEALKMCQAEGKMAFVYLHSPDHPFTAAFCLETLCSEIVVPFLDANFVCWAGIPGRGDGLQAAATLTPATFPFCAVVSPACGDGILVLQQIEGPVSPAQLVETLQATLEEHGLPFGSLSDEDEGLRRANRHLLRQVQDAAYLEALKAHTEKERLKKLPLAEANPAKKDPSKGKQAVTATREGRHKGKGSKDSQILIRFPDGKRREQTFSRTDRVLSVYEYIDSLGLPDIGDYQLISCFPRRVFGMEQIGLTLKDAGLHPRASLFVELL